MEERYEYERERKHLACMLAQNLTILVMQRIDADPDFNIERSYDSITVYEDIVRAAECWEFTLEDDGFTIDTSATREAAEQWAYEYIENVIMRV